MLLNANDVITQLEMLLLLFYLFPFFQNAVDRRLDFWRVRPERRLSRLTATLPGHRSAEPLRCYPQIQGAQALSIPGIIIAKSNKVTIGSRNSLLLLPAKVFDFIGRCRRRRRRRRRFLPYSVPNSKFIYIFFSVSSVRSSFFPSLDEEERKCRPTFNSIFSASCSALLCEYCTTRLQLESFSACRVASNYGTVALARSASPPHHQTLHQRFLHGEEETFEREEAVR